jgi:hypothetical protein
MKMKKEKEKEKKNGRRKTAEKSGRIGQEAHKQGRSESPAMQPKAARLMPFDDSCVHGVTIWHHGPFARRLVLEHRDVRTAADK